MDREKHLYIDTWNPGELVLTDSPKAYNRRHCAVLRRKDVGKLLNVLDGLPGATAECSDGFRLVHNHPESDDSVDYVATFDDGTQVGFGAYDARVLKLALEQACLALCRTRT